MVFFGVFAPLPLSLQHRVHIPVPSLPICLYNNLTSPKNHSLQESPPPLLPSSSASRFHIPLIIPNTVSLCLSRLLVAQCTTVKLIIHCCDVEKFIFISYPCYMDSGIGNEFVYNYQILLIEMDKDIETRLFIIIYFLTFHLCCVIS